MTCLQVTIGPWTERGFFYDFDMPQALTERDLPKIRKEMQRILRKNLPFVREEVSVEEARARIQARHPGAGALAHAEDASNAAAAHACQLCTAACTALCCNFQRS